VNPSTWADGFGIWHASVPATDNRRSDAALARSLIMAELEARSAPGVRPVFRIKLKYKADDTLVYCEAT
jgi:hypothetical protein